MIECNYLEKDFMERIVRLSEVTQNIFLGNLLNNELNHIDVYLDRNRGVVEFRFDNQYFQADSDFITMVRNKAWSFMKLVKLLKYLERENYIYLYQESMPENEFRFGQLVSGNPYIVYQIYDPEIKNLLIDYSHRTIIVGQTIIDYVRNNFKTREQIRHIDNLRIAVIAIVISLLLGLLGIWS